MTDSLQALKQLAYLARENTDQVNRRTILRRITDVFLDAPGSFSKEQYQHFGVIMEKLAFDLEREVREELARRIAAEADAPRQLVQRLASDEISVAQPVLEQSPVLTENDLIELSEQSSQDHLLAITKRMDVGARLSAVLVYRGQDGVVESLVQNDKAELAPDTVQRIAVRATNSDMLQSALVERKDVPRDIMIGLLEHVSDTLKHTILDKLTDTDRENLDDVVSSMRADIEESDRSRAERYIENLVRRGALNEDVLLRLAFDDKPMEFILGFAKMLNVDVLTVQRILTDKTGQALTIACRANRFSVETFKEIALSPMTSIASDLQKLLPLVCVYKTLKEESAQRAMRFWQARKLASRG
ncbi:hypothetical protein MnTg02_01271 [bacterium MnTg02]|nr:hypothetical protein MnTg02_01271 [bacterium MnTg02]